MLVEKSGFFVSEPFIPYKRELPQSNQEEHSTPSPTNKATYGEEERFTLLQRNELIDSEGIATTTFKEQKLQPITDDTKEYILDIVNQSISPKPKDLDSLGETKKQEAIASFEHLFAKYSYALPFTFDRKNNTIQFHTAFSLVELVFIIKKQIFIDKEIELIGGGAAEVLGTEYFATMIHSWIAHMEGLSKEAPPINDWDFWVQARDLQKIIETIINFLLSKISIIEHAELADLDHFRLLIRQTAFKNLCDSIENKILIGFANANGFDFDITFATTKIQAPFSYRNGLVIGIPNDFDLKKEIVPYAPKETNPVQCITDQFIGLLNGPSINDPKTRIEWILSSWTKGSRLFCTSWQEEIAKPCGEITLNPNEAHLPEHLFAKMVETINRFLLMRKMGHIEESTYYFNAFSEVLKNYWVYEEEISYLILSSLFTNFSDPIKGLYYLYLLSLYTLPLETNFPFRAGFARNGSFECLALQIPFKNSTRTLYFSAPFENVPLLTQEECTVVTKWFSFFANRVSVSKDQMSFEPFLMASHPNATLLSFFFGCEQALFGRESPSYDHFFDLAPLKQIIHAPIFAISRINSQFGLRGQTGFDLTERAIKANAPTPGIAWAFIQDSQRLATPLSLRKIAPSLVTEIVALFTPDEVETLLCQWIALAIDTELAPALVRYGANYIGEEKLLERLQWFIQTERWSMCVTLLDNANSRIAHREADLIAHCEAHKEQLVAQALENASEATFLLLVDLFKMESLNFWLMHKEALQNAPKAITKRFIAFLSHLDKFADSNKDAFIQLFETFQLLNITSLPKNYLKEAAKLSLSLQEPKAFRKSALKVFNKSVCTQKDLSNIPQYFLYRNEFPIDDAELASEDLLAFTLFPLETKTQCFTTLLEVAISLYNRGHLTDSAFEKMSAILESAIKEDSLLYKKSHTLSRLTNGFTAKGCCHILNSCTTHFRTNNDLENIVFWVTSLLDCLKTEKKNAAASLKIDGLMECIKLLIDPTILSHSSIQKVLSNKQLKTAYAYFLEGTLTRAITVDRPIQTARAIAFYQEYFPKLELSSPEEQTVTRKAIKLLCRDLPTDVNVEPFFKKFFDLAHSVLEAEKCPNLVANALNVLLWKTDVVFTDPRINREIKEHMKLKILDRWKDRFFEIAVDTIYELLDATPRNTDEHAMRLALASYMISQMQNTNARRSRLVPLVEKLLFSPLSTSELLTYSDNVKNVKLLYPLVDECYRSHPEYFYKTTLIIGRSEWSDSPFEFKKKIVLFNSVLDFQINAKQPLALEIACDFMYNGSLIIFDKRNDLRIAAYKKLIDAAFTMPYARTCTESKAAYIDTTLSFLYDLTGNCNIPLLRVLIDSIICNQKQHLTDDNKNASKEGLPIIQTLTSRLIPLCLKDADEAVTTEEFVSILLTLWERAARFHIFTSEKQYVDMINAFIEPTMIQKILASISWEELCDSYYTLFTLPLINGKESSELRIDLFQQFIKLLLVSDTIDIVKKGKALLNKGMTEGLYKNALGKIGKDVDLMKLLQRAL